MGVLVSLKRIETYLSWDTFNGFQQLAKQFLVNIAGRLTIPMRYPHTLLTLNQNLSTVVTKQRELVKYVAIENTFQNFQMGPMQHLDRETCIRNISGRPGFNGFWNVCSSWELWPSPLGHLIIFSPFSNEEKSHYRDLLLRHYSSNESIYRALSLFSVIDIYVVFSESGCHHQLDWK